MDYDELKKKLSIDLLRLDQEMTELPFLVQEAAEMSSETFNELQKADVELDIEKASAAARMREEDPKTSEARIASCLILDPQVQEATKKLNELKYLSKLSSDLVTNLRDKSRLLGKIADLTIAGYISPNGRKAFDEEARERATQRSKVSR